MSFHPISERPNFVFYPPKPGKPSLDELFSVPHDNRSRVVQKGTSTLPGMTCVEANYINIKYAFNYLRVRIGPIHPPIFLKERGREVIVSSCLKAIREDMQLLSKVERILSLWPKRGSIRIKKTFEEHALVVSATQFLEENPSATQSGYLQNLHLKRLQQRLYSQLDSMQEVFPDLFSEILEMKKQPTQEDTEKLASTSAKVIAKLYDLRPIRWNPEKPFIRFWNILKNKGPFSLHGSIGRLSYNSKPLQREEPSLERPIHYWKKGSERIQLPGMGHSIVVIGAEKTNQLVYFIDPLDTNDPAAGGSPVYVTTYNNLCRQVVNLNGNRNINGDIPFGYNQAVQDIKKVVLSVLEQQVEPN